MSNRLTQAIKDHLVKEESFAKYEKPIKDANSLFIKELEAEVQKIVNSRMHITQDLIKSRYVATTNYASYLCDDIDENHSHYKTKNFDLTKSFPRYHNESNFSIGQTPKLQELRKKWADLNSDRKKFESQLKTLLRAFTTKTALVKAVPEFEFYFKHELKMSSALVPMSQIMDIRKQLATFDITKKKAKNA
jgi:hypothetical protein